MVEDSVFYHILYLIGVIQMALDFSQQATLRPIRYNLDVNISWNNLEQILNEVKPDIVPPEPGVQVSSIVKKRTESGNEQSEKKISSWKLSENGDDTI